jgi:hypothetical protein
MLATSRAIVCVQYITANPSYQSSSAGLLGSGMGGLADVSGYGKIAPG